MTGPAHGDRGVTSGTDLTYVDVFAGCGGLSLGLHLAGWEGIFAVEKDPMAFETLSRNLIDEEAPYRDFQQWPEWLPERHLAIEELLGDKKVAAQLRRMRGTVSLVAGGPPCQGFSVGGIRDGSDTRNQLIHRMLEFVKLVQPTAVLIENVEGIARRFVSKPGEYRASVADHAVELLKRAGYDATFLIVNASEFGVPQLRRRVLIVGISRDFAHGAGLGDLFSEALDDAGSEVFGALGLAANRPVTARQALHDLAGKRIVPCPDSNGFTAGTYITPQSRYAQLMRRGLGNDQLPDSHRFSKHGERIQRMYQLAHETQPPGRLSKHFLLSFGTKKDKKVLLDPSAPASTITTHPDEFIHYAAPRNVTVREMARLQSFPDDFRFYGRYTINGPRRRFDVARCSQVGNAVPPLLAQAVGLALHRLTLSGAQVPLDEVVNESAA